MIVEDACGGLPVKCSFIPATPPLPFARNLSLCAAGPVVPSYEMIHLRGWFMVRSFPTVSLAKAESVVIVDYEREVCEKCVKRE